MASQSQPSAGLKPSEILDRAAALIEPEGAWAQDDFAVDANGVAWGEWSEWAADGEVFEPVCFCIYGAVAAAKGAPDLDEPAAAERPFILAALGLPKGALPSRVADWNDAKDRTQAEVVAALRQAAELARSEGR